MELETCCICLDSLGSSPVVALLGGQRRCAHLFHAHCAERLSPQLCPLCREPFATLTVLVTCELITCIEAGLCDCDTPFKAFTVVGHKWAKGGCREWAAHKVHSTTWQHKHDPKLFTSATTVGFNPDSVTAIEDQWNSRSKTGFKHSGERKQKKTTRRNKLPQQTNKLLFKPTI